MARPPKRPRPDKAKQARRQSRAVFGRPGQGRKTSHVDRKKEADRTEARRPSPPPLPPCDHPVRSFDGYDTFCLACGETIT